MFPRLTEGGLGDIHSAVLPIRKIHGGKIALMDWDRNSGLSRIGGFKHYSYTIPPPTTLSYTVIADPHILLPYIMHVAAQYPLDTRAS